MAQADGNIANQAGAQFRADLNNQLLALFTQHSGSASPLTTYAFQPWVDTSASPAVYKIRNSANTGWITIGTLDSTFAVGGITPIANGGTGQTTASAAINALLPTQTGNTDKFLKTDGTAVSWAIAAAGASMQALTSSGTYTPTAGKTSFLVFCTGGGGGGLSANTASGAGAGGTAIRLYSLAEMGSSAVVTVGAGGALNNNGGSSSFDPAGTGLTITGNGGSKGQAVDTAVNVGGAGGGASNGMINAAGQRGGTNGHWRNTSSNVETYSGGSGGASFFGGGPGGGGGSGDGSSAGQNGVILVLEF